MRIISQDGMRDAPYEQVAVLQDARDERKISAVGVNTDGEYSYFPMAEYRDKERAQKAMEMLREEYGKFQTTKTGTGFYFAFDYPRIFRFPADSEIEVNMRETCELFKLIPREKIIEIFEASEMIGAECDSSFLGFEEVYKAVTLFAPKSKVIIDLGCAYAFQSWYFQDYRKYIGVDISVRRQDVLETENSEFYFMSIQNFIKDVFPGLRYSLDEVFAICSYVPDDEAREMVKNFFHHCLVYYPTRTNLMED